MSAYKMGVFPFHAKWTQQETSICHCQIRSTSTLHPFPYETVPGKRLLPYPRRILA